MGVSGGGMWASGSALLSGLRGKVFYWHLEALRVMFLLSMMRQLGCYELLHPSQNICRFRFSRNNFDKIYIKKY